MLLEGVGLAIQSIAVIGQIATDGKQNRDPASDG